MVDRHTWNGDLASYAGHLDNAAALLLAQMRQRGADHLDGAHQVGVDLMM